MLGAAGLALLRSWVEWGRGWGMRLFPALAELNKCPFVACPGVLGRAGTHSQSSQQWPAQHQRRQGYGYWGGCHSQHGANVPPHYSALHRALQHTNLLQCLAQCAEVTPYLLVMEFCPLVSPWRVATSQPTP